jgi:hypothetical protein
MLGGRKAACAGHLSSCCPRSVMPRRSRGVVSKGGSDVLSRYPGQVPGPVSPSCSRSHPSGAASLMARSNAP